MRATTFEERISIGKLSKKGLFDQQIAEQLSLSIATVRKWRRRGERLGWVGLQSVMGCPCRGALSMFSEAVVTQLEMWRQQHPSWGPKTIWLG
jgi:transposase